MQIFFVEFVFTNLNKCIEQSVFPLKFKLAYITPGHKKTQKAQKTITGLPVFYKIYLKYMRSSCLSKCLKTLNHFYRNISVDYQNLLLIIGRCLVHF